MTRRTRAAQRAVEETDIHNDETATRVVEQPAPGDENATTDAKISLTVKSSTSRQPLQEVAANCGEQIEELQRQFPSQDENGTVKGKGGKKGTTKGKKVKKATEPSASRKRPEEAETVSDVPVAHTGESEQQDKGSPLKRQEQEDASTAEDVIPHEAAGRSEAVQKLESMFEKPEVEPEVSTPLASVVPKRSSPTHSSPQHPIEALDALEDAIEEVGNAMPKPMPELQNPAHGPAKKRSSKISPVASSAVTLPRETKASTLRKNSGQKSNAKPLAVITNKKTDANTESGTTMKRKPPSPQSRPETAGKRKSSIAALNTPPPAVKSSKPPTKSDFRLPSEAIVAKLKAQKEERQKKQEEQSSTLKRTSSVRSAPRLKPVEVKGTSSSRARASLLAEPQPKDDKAQPTTTSTRPIKRTSSINAGAPNNSRLSTISLAHRPKSAVFPSTASTQSGPSTLANKRARPSSTIIAKPSPKMTAGVANGAQSRAPSGSKPSGKEIFNRDRLERETQQMSLKEKQDAARRAREAAAERGRQASREWAERMKTKKMKDPTSQKPITEKGTSAGVTPRTNQTTALDGDIASDSPAVTDVAA